MAYTTPLFHKSFHTPGWHGDADTPVVDNKYIDKDTGKVVVVPPDHAEYLGPPAIDIIISCLHDSNEGGTGEGAPHGHRRSMRAFPMDALLRHVLRVAYRHKHQGVYIDSVMATPFAIRLTIGGDFSSDEYDTITDEMMNGIWDVTEEDEGPVKEKKEDGGGKK
ncbi:hypothetical protein Sste5346_008570 [Sporothrix stenoceras]|uniref:Uncharacterized protein n=1 Tax=Sporothrix stenoceras TaxID=5173 RepID=A0ABR3YQ42_9PEZI